MERSSSTPSSVTATSLKRISAFRTIKVRLTLLFCLILTVLQLLFSAYLYNEFVEVYEREFNAALYNYTVDYSNAIDFNLFGDLSLDPRLLNEEQKVFPFSLGRVLFQIRRNDLVTIARSRELGLSNLPITADEVKDLERNRATFKTVAPQELGLSSRESSYRQINYLVPRKDYRFLILQIAVPLSFLEAERKGLLTTFYFFVPMIILSSALGGFLFARRALAPVNQIIGKAQEINAGSLSERLPVPPVEDEISRLAVTINNLLDRLQGAFQSQERFIADASHQLKTPLAILRGELDVMMSRPRQKEELEEFLRSASQEISLLGRTVEDLLLLARIDAGNEAPGFSDVRMDEVVMSEAARLEKFAQSKKVRLNFEFVGFEEEDFPIVKGDRYLLAALTYNLIENAIKYSPEGESVRVEVQNKVSSVRLTISDKGPGIPKESLDRIFERFYRVHSSDAKASGVGLGLSIAQKIANLHSSQIEVQSEPGRGATFSVEIKKN